ncbi:hypothetical protein MCUN1_000022 [Malassezia cuniculi]|uniref:Peregrin n=1 Tax=Malassezia cuniculi TaxID=948313 RepID=A0AAF0J5C0_9BASI|nr:hypothetical protein MCUN1_000022 [Malassezia cuniculi]
MGLASATEGAARLRPSFRLVPDDELEELSSPAGVSDVHMVQYGYHDGTELSLPASYLRHLEPTDADLDKQVEYDMDEQDHEWLTELNEERKKKQLDVISCEAFEIILDRLEKEWFALMKRIPSRFSDSGDGDEDAFPEESFCQICNDNECENSNAIVFCDGCNLAVHQDCYGIPYIPEGQWLCRTCTVSPDRPVSCVLCPNEGGALKQTTSGKWAHLMCAMWIPETGVGNAVFMEPIDGIEHIPKARWKLRCYLCNKRSGACIQCERRSCFTAFHVTCARRAHLLTRVRRRVSDHGDHEEPEEPVQLSAYCHHHLPDDQKEELRAKLHGDDDDAQSSDSDWSADLQALVSQRTRTHETIATRSARAYHRLYSSGPLPVPNYIVRRVLDYISRIQIRRKPQTVTEIVRYWSLKRQHTRGAPLLKRLHIEPWTVGIYVDERNNALKLAKLQYVYRLREDLEKIRLLAELVRKREKEKLRQLRAFRNDVIQDTLLHAQARLREALDKITALDRDEIFALPVSLDDAPDYLDVVKNPMDWSTIRHRIDSLAYKDSSEFVADVRLVCANAMLYNAPDTPYHRSAQRILKQAGPILDGLTESLEPRLEAVQALRDPPPPPQGTLVGGSAGDDTFDAFLSTSFGVEVRRSAPPTPSRRSTRHAKDVEETPVPEQPKKAKHKASRTEQKPAAPAAPTAPKATQRIVTARQHKAASSSKSKALAPGAAAPHVDSVSNHDSFKYFESGWILPEGARRGNRPRPQPKPQSQPQPQPQPQPAAQKRSRKRTRAHTDDVSSDLSDVPE